MGETRLGERLASRSRSDTLKTVRIGAGSGFCFDSALAIPQLLRDNPPDYIFFEHLAEGAMAMFYQIKRLSPELGYSTTIVDLHVGPYIAEMLAAGVKIITNAGGLNLKDCVDALVACAARAGCNPRIAAVEGDDLRAQIPQFAKDGHREMFSGEAWPDNVVLANAYLGAFPIARALDMGADIVVTGRCVDSALVLGPLIHEFGWGESDYDQLAAGTAAGHLLECGTQVTGGTFTDWLDFEDVKDFGFPIAEVSSDGAVIITKPEGTGGTVSVGTVSEQLLYEVSDPGDYLVPDVSCDFTNARIRQVAENRVEVTGVKGKAPSGSYKVCCLAEEGWRVTATIPVIGADAVEKARRLTETVLDRTSRLLDMAGVSPWKAVQVDHIGSGETFQVGPRSNATQTEIVCRIALLHDSERGATIFRNEAMATGTSGCPGNVSMGGMLQVLPAQRLFSFLLPRDRVTISITLGDQRFEMRETANPARHQPYALSSPVAEAQGGDEMVPLVALAWGRSGDKGNLYNVAVIARRPEYMPYLRAALTVDAFSDWMRHTFDDPQSGKVKRYDAPGMNAMNFVVEEGLRGGSIIGLQMDSNAKGMAQKLLQMPIKVPAALAIG